MSDGRVIEMLQQYLKQEVMDGMQSWTPEEGTPQGAISQPDCCRTSIWTHWTMQWPRGT